MRKLIKSQSYNSISDTPVPQWAKKGRPSNLDGRDKLALSEKCPNINLPNTKQLKSKSFTHIMVGHLSLSFTLGMIKNQLLSFDPVADLLFSCVIFDRFIFRHFLE